MSCRCINVDSIFLLRLTSYNDTGNVPETVLPCDFCVKDPILRTGPQMCMDVVEPLFFFFHPDPTHNHRHTPLVVVLHFFTIGTLYFFQNLGPK